MLTDLVLHLTLSRPVKGLLFCLSCGGMPTVYLAEDLKHKRKVAVEHAREQRTLKRTLT